MDKNMVVSVNPHIYASQTTQTIMRDVLTATHTTSTSSARTPKNSAEANTAGSRAISTSRMMVWVVWLA